MKNIYIFGHRKPDTDSVTGSIALSYLKNKLGIHSVPKVLGSINNETKFVLDYFHVKEPGYLNDVKLQTKDTNYLKNYFLNENQSIFEGFQYMNENNIGNLPIVNSKQKFVGLISMKDIAKNQMSDDIHTLTTSYDNIVKTLNGEEIIKCEEEINANILVASYRSTTFIENIDINSNTALIVGDRHSIIEYAVLNKCKIIILTGNSEIKEKHLEIAKKNKVNIIRTNLDTFTTARRIWLSNYLKTILINQEIICFNEEETTDDIIDKTKRYKYTNYPVLDKKGKCLGMLRLSDLNDANKKKVILVDHNEAIQSVDGLEEAEILEIIDHHKIGTIGTTMPINFRNMPVGSSNTIIYMLYKENHIEIPKDIAGLMLSGIISDTLLFKSPTTTPIDKVVVEDLAKIAEINYEIYGMDMLKAGSSLKGKTKEEILYTDFKNFTIDNKKIGVGQILTLNIDEIDIEKEEYVTLMNNIAKNNDYYAIVLFATDIIKNGSYMYFNENAKDLLENSFDIDELKQGHYLDGCVSRKKQIIPNIINAIEKK